MFKFVCSIVPIPSSTILPAGKSNFTFVFSFILLSSSIIKSNFSSNDMFSIPALFNSVPSTFIASLSLYCIFPKSFTITPKSIIPPWFDICTFSSLTKVSCAPSYSILSPILYGSSYLYTPSTGLYISMVPCVSFLSICMLFIVIFLIIASFLYCYFYIIILH